MARSNVSRRMAHRALAFVPAAWIILVLLPTRIAAQQPLRTEQISFASNALGKQAMFSVVTPLKPAPAGGYPVLIILHGLGRNHRTLLDNPGTLALLQAQPFLIVLPDSARGWWIDSPISHLKYDSMLQEVLQQVRRRYTVSASPSQWGIAGWSMGGFGALHFAERHPKSISFVGSIIGLLDFPRVEGLPIDQRFTVDTSVFGDDIKTWSKQNPSQHLGPLRGKDLVIVIGEQAFDRTMNDNFVQQAKLAGLQPEVHRIPGEHVFSTVDAGLQIILPRAAAHFSKGENPGR